VCASAVVMLDTPCSEVVWRVLATHYIRQFPLHFPSWASPCAITFQLESTSKLILGVVWIAFLLIAVVLGSFPNNCFYFKALGICLLLQQFAAKRGDQESLLESMNSKYYYYTRTKGLFRICYPKERPPTGKFLTPRRKQCWMVAEICVCSSHSLVLQKCSLLG